MTCICCDGDTKRFGSFRNRNGVVRRFQCLKCGKTFSEQRPLAGVRTETDKTVQVVKMLCEGLGVRSTARLSGVEKKTVLNILKTAGEHCTAFLDTRLHNLPGEPLEVDECWTFVSNKRNQGNTDITGDFYAFLASGQKTKLVVSFIVGKRNEATGGEFIRDIAGRVPDQFQITSDGWRGFIRGVLDNTFERANYAVQIKKYDGYNRAIPGGKRIRYSPGRCVAVNTRRICGSPDREATSTSHAERLNLSLRHFNKRFTRLSPCFSKKMENLVFSVALTVAFFNFCRPHKTLKISGEDGDASIERTPAMAAGLTDHIWTVEELLTQPL